MSAQPASTISLSKPLSNFIAAIALSTLLFVTAKLSASAQAPAEPTAPKTAHDQYKNIQTLKDIPADQLIPAMQFISASLGVECEYCHVHGALDKDDKKPKLTARKMITMMHGHQQRQLSTIAVK
jgi:hypothetical protein